MNFTDRFIKVPTEMVKPPNDCLGTKEEHLCFDFMMINPFDIIAYRKHYDKEGEYNDCTFVDLKMADSFVCQLSIEDFEKLLNEYQK